MMTVFILLVVWVAMVGVLALILKGLGAMNNYVFSGSDALLMSAIASLRQAVNFGFMMVILGMIPYIGSLLGGIMAIGMIICLIHAFPIIFGWLIAFIMGFFGDEILFNLPVPMLKFYSFVSPIDLRELVAMREGNIDECLDIFFLKYDMIYNPEFVEEEVRLYKDELSEQG